jgi:hypothetical protein
MCGEKAKCERPKDLKATPQQCSAEQIKKCHGSDKTHPCTAPAKKK